MAEYVYLCDAHAREINRETLAAARRIVVAKMRYEHLHMVALAVSGTECAKSPDIRRLPYQRMRQWCSLSVFAYEKVLRPIEASAHYDAAPVEGQA